MISGLCRDYVALYLLTRHEFPQAPRPFEMLSLHRDIAIGFHVQSGIADHERITVFSYGILRVQNTPLIEIRRQVRNGYGAELLPTELLRLVLEEFIIIILTVITTVINIVGSPFRDLVYLGGSSRGNRGGDSGFRLPLYRRRLFLRGYPGSVDGGW